MTAEKERIVLWLRRLAAQIERDDIELIKADVSTSLGDPLSMSTDGVKFSRVCTIRVELGQ